MKPIAKMSQLELAAFVQEHLRKHGIDSVLTGGSAVTLYSQNHYVSRDVDLIILSVVHRRALRQAMEEIGFVDRGGILCIRTARIPSSFRQGLWL